MNVHDASVSMLRIALLVTAMVAGAATLSGCGQKGALVLPTFATPPPPPPMPSASTPAQGPAMSARPAPVRTP